MRVCAQLFSDSELNRYFFREGHNIKMLSRLIIIGSALLSVNTVLHADAATNSSVSSAGSSSINIHTAISQTLEQNPTLRTFEHELRAQQGRQLQAGLSASPKISFELEDAFGSGDFQDIDSAQMTLGIAWVLEGDIRQGFIDVAQAGTSSLTTQAKIQRLDVAAETARLYIISLANQTRLDNAAKTVSLAKKTVNAVKKRVSAGRAPKAELARAQADLAYRQLEHEDVEHEFSSSIRLLAAQWGETQPSFKKVTGSIFAQPKALPFETLKKRLAQSPDFIRLMSDKRLSQAKLKLAKSQSSPEWNVNIGVRHSEARNDQSLVAGISIPFGERSRNTGNIIEARENLLQAQAKENELKVRFETVLYVLFEELEHNLHRVDSYQNNIIPKLETALVETQRAYQLGRYSYLEWQSVQADLLTARMTLLEASIAAHLKFIEIERLTGVSMTQSAKSYEE